MYFPSLMFVLYSSSERMSGIKRERDHEKRAFLSIGSLERLYYVGIAAVGQAVKLFHNSRKTSLHVLAIRRHALSSITHTHTHTQNTNTRENTDTRSMTHPCTTLLAQFFSLVPMRIWHNRAAQERQMCDRRRMSKKEWD